MNYCVSVIIPVYKVERFIERCCIHLFEQTLHSVEFIFVDDCSPDNSIAIVTKVLDLYPTRKRSTQIIKHEHNKGLPSARNTGIKTASGEYIFHCDSDDWLEKDALLLLYDFALEKRADAVWCDWYLSFKNNERYMSQSFNKQQIYSGKEVVKLMLGGKIRYNVWNKLVKRKLYTDNSIGFPDNYGMGEDMTMIKIFAHADKVGYLSKGLYHYVQLNEDAFTKKTTTDHLEQIRYNVDEIIRFLEKKFRGELNEDIQFFKLNIKLPFLISDDVKSYERWLDWYPESNEYIDKNLMFSKRIKFLQKAALNHQYWILKLYYYLVIRVVYGIIFK